MATFRNVRQPIKVAVVDLEEAFPPSYASIIIQVIIRRCPPNATATDDEGKLIEFLLLRFPIFIQRRQLTPMYGNDGCGSGQQFAPLSLSLRRPIWRSQWFVGCCTTSGSLWVGVAAASSVKDDGKSTCSTTTTGVGIKGGWGGPFPWQIWPKLRYWMQTKPTIGR